ncbi:hypothetical protein ACFL2V_10485 [Pseudomonadota bacterium]
MFIILKRTRWMGFFVALIVPFFVASCTSNTPKKSVPGWQNPWPAAYQKAIEDARNPEPSEVVHNLTPIRQDSRGLIWESIDGAPHVLMASLVSDASYYKAHVGKSYNMGNYFAWVTAAPILRNMCGGDGFSEGNMDMRLREVLGLTPNATIKDFVQFWVKEDHLFRPAPDNEISDSTAGLNFPSGTEAWYRAWFNDLRAKQYFQSTEPENNAYPWTQLGYTYDWGSNASSEQGLSEFVIKSNADVVIEGIYGIEEYCSPH